MFEISTSATGVARTSNSTVLLPVQPYTLSPFNVTVNVVSEYPGVTNKCVG